MKRACGSLVFCACAIFAVVIWHRATAGFSPQKIFVASLLEERNDVRYGNIPPAILHKPWTYLGKGRQTYVFLSADGCYVIKFFRYHLATEGVFSYQKRFFLPDFSSVKSLKKLRDWIASTDLALAISPQKSGIIYFQPDPLQSRFSQHITLIDALGRRYTIDLQKTSCLIQKKAQLLQNAMDVRIQNRDLQGFLSLVEQYFSLQKALQQQGVVNRDPCPFRNTGVSEEGEVFDIDVGRYGKIVGEQEYAEVFEKVSQSLESYIASRCPQWKKPYLEKKKHFLPERSWNRKTKDR